MKNNLKLEELSTQELKQIEGGSILAFLAAVVMGVALYYAIKELFQ